MVTGKITAVCGVPGSAFPAIKPGTAQALAYAASSVQSAVLGCVVVRVVATTDCHIYSGRSEGSSLCTGITMDSRCKISVYNVNPNP
jgi:hypothetical protein